MKMELKDALELAIDALEFYSKVAIREADDYREAARLLREGSEKVEHVEDANTYKCIGCGCLSHNASACPECLVPRVFQMTVWATRVYTTHHELKIIEVTSEPTFVEIGGSDSGS